MGGQERFKHVREGGIKCCWTKIRKGVQRRKWIGLWLWIASVIDRVESRTCRSE
jgi:hypothetical protein